MGKKGQLPSNFDDKLKSNIWKPGQSGNPNGRPKSRVNEFLQSVLTVKQVKENTMLNDKEIDAIEQIVLSLDTKSLQSVAKSESAPAYLRTLAMAAIWDMKNGKTKTVDLLRDRQFGSVKKNVDVTTNGQSMNERELSDKEARELIKRLEKEF